jgi:hypothetical protein
MIKLKKSIDTLISHVDIRKMYCFIFMNARYFQFDEIKIEQSFVIRAV